MTEHQLTTYGECGLYVDLQPEATAPIKGDWITTEAGSRYLITGSRRVESRRRHSQKVRYQLRCVRLAKHIEVPGDVRAIELRWYRR